MPGSTLELHDLSRNIEGTSQAPQPDGVIRVIEQTLTEEICEDDAVSVGHRQKRTWWSEHITLTLNPACLSIGDAFDPRDFEALERTNLAYVRTANAFAIFGVLMTQLYVIANIDRNVGVVFASITYCGAIIITALGCLRYFILQKGLVRRTPIHKGWYIVSIWMFTLAIAVGLFITILVS